MEENEDGVMKIKEERKNWWWRNGVITINVDKFTSLDKKITWKRRKRKEQKPKRKEKGKERKKRREKGRKNIKIK